MGPEMGEKWERVQPPYSAMMQQVRILSDWQREREVKHLRETTKKTQRTYFKLKRRGRFNHVTHCCLGWLQWQSLHRPRTLEHHQPAAPHAPHSQVGINPESPVELNKTQHIIVICMNRFMFFCERKTKRRGEERKRKLETWISYMYGRSMCCWV